MKVDMGKALGGMKDFVLIIWSWVRRWPMSTASLATVAYLAIVDPLGCSEINRVYELEGETLASPSLRAVKESLQAVVPAGARDIKVAKYTGDFMGGASMTVKCTVSPDAMRRFARETGLDLRYDSTVVNVCTNGPEVTLDALFPCNAFLYDDWKKAAGKDTGEFWSFVKVYPNHGGERCVYFVASETFFYDWSSN